MQFCLPFFRTCGRHIESLDKSHLNLEEIPDDVLRNYRTLEDVNLEANQIHEFPKNFFRLERLRWLSMSDNELSEVPPAFGNFIHLVHLDLSNNEIYQITSNIHYCDNLIHLNLSHNPLDSLPETFTDLQRLRTLNLTETSLTRLPEDFGKLQRLEKLELRGTILQELPKSFAELQQLQTLDLGGNEFMNFPIQITSLNNLQELFLDGNHLLTLPEEINLLTKLENLDVAENEIDTLPDHLTGLTSLLDINLRANRMETMPPCIGDLHQIRLINMDSNLIASISPRISCCIHLSELILSSNCIAELPSEIGQLCELTFLSLFCNHLSVLPSTISSCHNLKILLLRENRLRSLPSEIGQLKSLRVLDVADNRLVKLPSSILKCDNLVSLWLSTNQSNSSVKLQTDIDPKTGETLLTCFLLPQEGAGRPDSLTGDMDNDENGPEVIKRQSVAMEDGQSLASVPQEENKNRLSFVEDEGRGKLRTYIRFDKKAVDGHVILKDDSHSKETAFSPGRGSPLPPHRDTNLESNVAELKNSILRKMSAPPLSRASLIVPASCPILDTDHGSLGLRNSCALTSETPHSKEPSNKLTQAELLSNKGDRIRSISTVAYPGAAMPTGMMQRISNPGELVPSRKTGTTIRPTVAQLTVRRTHDEEQESSHKTNEDESIFLLKTQDISLNTSRATSLLSNTSMAASVPNDTESGKVKKSPKVVDHMPSTEDDNHESVEENEEESEYRRVGFYEEVYEAGDDEDVHRDMKLMRKDTPHYTKHARINYKLINGVDNAMTVKNILEKYQHMSHQQAAPLSSQQSVNGSLSVEECDIVVNGDGDPGEQHSSIPAEEVILIRKSDTLPLGLTVVGGIDHACPPFDFQQRGVFIAKITPGSAASLCPTLSVGDRILQVNQTDFTTVTHAEAVRRLIAATSHDLQLRIKHEESPPGLMHVDSLPKCLLIPGLHIAGGLRDEGDTSPCIIQDPNDDGIILTRLPDTCTNIPDFKLHIGQRILEVNGQSLLLGATCSDVVKIFSQAGPTVNLTVCDGILPEDVEDFLQKWSQADTPVDVSKNSTSFCPTLNLPKSP